MKLKISRRIFVYYISVFLIFNETFLSSLSYIYVFRFSRAVNMLLELIGLGLFIVAQFTYKKQYKNYPLVFRFLIGMILIVYIVGMGIYPQFLSQTFRFAVIMLFILFGYRDCRWIEVLMNLLLWSGLIYIVTTIWFTFDKAFYLKYFAYSMYPKATNYDFLGNSGTAGITDHYSTNGMMLAGITILLFSQMLSKREEKGTSWMQTVLFSLSAIALVLCGKRAHFAFVIVACFFTYYLFMRNNKNRYFKYIRFAFIVFVTYSLLMTYSSNFQKLMARFDTMATSSGTLIRYSLWGTGIAGFLKNPIFGVGWPGGRYLTLSVMEGYQDVHNEFIQILCETGIVGGVVFFTFFAGGIITAIRFVIWTAKHRKAIELKTKQYAIFSCCYQCFFLMYCITASPLHQAYVSNLYYFSVCLGVLLFYNKNKILKDSKEIFLNNHGEKL